MELCKHKIINEFSLVCENCGLTRQQRRTEWYEFIKDLQSQIDEKDDKISNLETLVTSLIARITSLEKIFQY